MSRLKLPNLDSHFRRPLVIDTVHLRTWGSGAAGVPCRLRMISWISHDSKTALDLRRRRWALQRPTGDTKNSPANEGCYQTGEEQRSGGWRLTQLSGFG